METGKKIASNPELHCVDLADRIVEVRGQYFTGKFSTQNKALFDDVIKAVTKPREYTIDLEEVKITLGSREFKGLQTFEEKDIGLFHELTYRLSMYRQGQKRLRQAVVAPGQLRSQADGRYMVTLNGSDYVKAN